jgi:hypothetical protein
VGVCLIALSGRQAARDERRRALWLANRGEGRIPEGQRIEGGQQLDIRPGKPRGVGEAQSTNRRGVPPRPGRRRVPRPG